MSKSETSFTDIYGYITNAFDKGKMTDVEKSIKANGEAEEVFHMMMFDYQYDKKYIDSLIGEDLEKSDNFFQKNRQKSDNETLNDKDKLKQSVMESNNGINLPKNFEEIRKAAETLAPAIEQMISEGGRENHVDYAVHTIAEHCGKPVETAKEIVSDLIDGISEFDMQYENLKQSGTMDLSGLLKDRTEDEKKKILINSLIAMKALESESFSEEDIESLYDKYGEYDIDELVTELKGAISENDYFNNIVNELATGENLTPELIAEFKKIAENNTDNPEKLLFKPADKQYTSLSDVNDVLKTVLKYTLGITDITTHSLRHTYGTRCIEAGMQPVVLQRLLGHKDISITLNTYTDVLNEFKNEEMEKVNNYYLNKDLLTNNNKFDTLEK